MTESNPRVETVRRRVRDAIESGALTVPGLVGATGLSDEAIRKFTRPGSSAAPYPRTLARYEQALATLGANPGGEAGPAASALPVVPLPLHVLTYWRGELNASVRIFRTAGPQIAALNATVASIGQSLEALGAMLEQATAGVSGLAASGILPGPDGGLPPGWHIPELHEPTPEQQAEIDREPEPTNEEMGVPETRPATSRSGGRGARTKGG